MLLAGAVIGLANTPVAGAVSSAPIAQPDSLVTDENTARSIDVLQNDTGNWDLASLVVLPPLLGSVTVDEATGLVNYAPLPHSASPDSFRYTVCDVDARCVTATVDVTVHVFGRYRLVVNSRQAGGAPGPFALQLPDGTGPLEPIPGASGNQSAISPDGQWLVTTSQAGVSLHALFEDNLVLQHALPYAESPSWSPSGDELVVGSQGSLYQFVRPLPPTLVEPWFLPEPKQFTYDISDGSGGTVTVPVYGYNPSWGSRGVAFENWWEYVTPVNRLFHIGIAVAPALGVTPFQLLDGSFHDPDWSTDDRLAVGCPDGLCIFSSNGGGMVLARVILGRLGPFDPNPGPSDPNDIRWSPDAAKIAFENTIVNVDGSALIRVNRMDPYATNLSWDPRAYTAPQPPSTRPGRLVYQSAQGIERSNPDASGRRVIATPDVGDYRYSEAPAWSPDGTKIAALMPDPLSALHELVVMNPDGTARTRLAGQVYGEIAWSPDGREILYSVQNCCNYGLFAIRPDGTGTRRVATYGVRFPSYSPDGRFIVFQDGDGQTARLAYLLADGSTAPAPLPGMDPSKIASQPEISSDGRLAFASVHIYVADVVWGAVPLAAVPRQLTFPNKVDAGHSDTFPTWAPDGTAMAFSRATQDVSGGWSTSGVYVINADGSRDTVVRQSPTEDLVKVSWGPPASTPGPTITSLDPTSGTVDGGTAVTITGTGFGGPGTTVRLDGQLATITSGSPTELHIITPPNTAGPADLLVINPDTNSAYLTAAYTYTDNPPPPPPPTITSIKPTSGPTAGGTKVTIAGTSFQVGATVSFGGVSGGRVLVRSSQKLVVTAPAHAAGSVSIVVTNPDGTSVTVPNGFTYIQRGHGPK